MQTGKLRVNQTNKGKLEKYIDYERDGKAKKVPVPNMDLKDASLNGVEVEFESDKGQVVKVTYQGKVIYPQESIKQNKVNIPKDNTTAYQKASSPGSFSKASTGSVPKGAPCRRDAKAPYNFIPLNSTVINWKMPPNIEADCDKYHDNCHTGVIEIDIETKTPLYIRGPLKQKDLDNCIESNEISAFFDPAGILRIPGSSLRGMIRTLVEIVSFSKFGYFDDTGLYYRGLADKSNLRNEYQQTMSSYDAKKKVAQYKISAGILSKEGFKYFINPAGTPNQIARKKAQSIIASLGKKYEPFEWYRNNNEFIVVSGEMEGKEKDWLINLPSNNVNRFEIPEKDVRQYNNDKNRSTDAPNLLKKASSGESPCFYVKWRDSQNNERVAFGHTGMFRLAYKKTIGEHIPIETIMDKNSSIDMAEAIFGNEKTFAGRVFFEDALLCESQGEVCMGVSSPKILSSPKPTTFQHYLEQDENADTKHYNTYNSNGTIRGNKLYWHQSGNNWQEKDKNKIQKHKSQYTEINPVKLGTRFKGRIRFENLRTEELGALLFAIDLPVGCCHKIGMGKPLGLGSIHIKPTLFISDRKARYANLFAEWKDISPVDNQRVSQLQKAFETFILRQIGDSGSQILWENQRISELALILDFEKGKALENNEKTRYMEIERQRIGNEFKDRPILVRPSELTK